MKINGHHMVIAALSFVLAISLCLGCGGKSTNPKVPTTEWTILVYADGNNNLDYTQGGNSYCIQDIQDLENIGSSDKVQIVAMVSSLKTGGIAKYYHIEHYPDDLGDNISSTMLANKGTKDMSDPQTLREFLNYGIANYPAKRYMVIIDDHGGGWRGACEDEQNGSGNLMSMVNLTNALEQSLSANGLTKFDVVTFHACLMAMVEVAYELRNCASYLVASEFSMPMESVLGSDEWLADLVANPTMTAEQLATNISEAVYNAGVAKQKYVHMAAIDLAMMNRLAAKVDNFATQIHTSAGDYWLEVLAAWLNTHTTQYDDEANVDLREFANKVKQQPHLQTINLIRWACDTLIAALNDAVLTTYTNAPGLTRGGLTIYMPYQRELFDETNYAMLDWAHTGWDEFLDDFIATIEQLTQTTSVSGTVTWPGHQLSAQCWVFAETLVMPQLYTYEYTNANPSNGEYTIELDNLSGTKALYFEAFDDVNGNGYLDLGEGYGFYDKNNSGNLDVNDSLMVSQHQQRTGVNIVLQTAAVTDGQPRKIGDKTAVLLMESRK